MRISKVLLFVLFAGCTREKEPVPPNRYAEMILQQRPEEGIAVVPTKSGGRAKREPVGSMPLPGTYELGGEMFEGEGGFGLGMGGLGSGGSGFGAGIGHGRTSVQMDSDGRSTQTERDEFVEPSAFAWAELQQPYRGGKTVHFQPRDDAEVNESVIVRQDLLSTFAVDVDTAAYSIARRTIAGGHLPEPSSVRVEEFVNYFRYDYDAPKADRQLFSIEADGAQSPLPGGEYVFRIGLQARVVSDADRLPANLVFLVDTSCSMTSEDKLKLAKQSLSIAVESLKPTDRVAISTYAGGVLVVLPPTFVSEKKKILDAIDGLESGGGTAMASGLKLAYELAGKMLAPGKITRVIVCSDGDANIGNTTPEKMLEEIAAWVSEGVTMSTIGFGDGNYKDQTMETIANKGNGNYFYIDDLQQARRVFARDLTKMLQDVATDVKIQVAFNPDVVEKYRLIGYENRAVKDEDFRNDRIDAGEIGAGHQVTALYGLELAPMAAGRLATIHVRAKKPGGMTAKETSVEVPVDLVDRPFSQAPDDLRFAVAVMGAAEIFRKSPYAKSWKLEAIAAIAEETASDSDPDRAELIAMIDRARKL
jgi:Ca-activated chloride channel family protein